MSPIHRGILIVVLHVVSHPWRTLFLAGVFLAACVLLATSRLTISTDQNKLFDPNVQFFKDYLSFVQKFPENEAIYVVIQTRDPKAVPPIPRWTGIADAIAARLEQMPQYVKAVDARVPVKQLGSQGLLFDDPKLVRENFQDVKRFIPLAKLWAEKPSFLTRLLGSTPIERFLSAVNTQPPDDDTAGFVVALADSWTQTIEHTGEGPLRVGKHIPDLASIGADDPSRLGYYYVPDESDPSRSIELVRVYHRERHNSLTAISETVDAIRKAVAEVSKHYPEFTTGLTGRPALDADEMRTTDQDSNRAEILALIAVFIGLVVFLRSFWLALAGEIALGVGIGWTFGWATVSVGELNLLSIVFLLALIGIGMDYLVQILTRYRMEAVRRATPVNIWMGVFRHVSAPINTACLGAAGAFLVSVFTRFRGAAQLGIIAGGGLILCLLAGYIILPALLTLVPPKFARRELVELPSLGRHARGSWRNLIPPLVWFSLILAGIPLMMRVRFDPSLIGMQAQNLESVRLINRLQTWSAVVLSHDLGVLREARSRLENSPEVARTESILQAYDNLDWLEAHENELPRVQWSEPAPVQARDLPGIANKAEQLAKHFSQAGGSSDAAAGADSRPATRASAPSTSSDYADTARALATFANKLHHAPATSAEQIAARLSEWQRAFMVQLKEALAPFHPGKLDINALPPELKSHFVGTDGSFALYIYPHADLWVQSNLAAFVHDVETRMKSLPGEHTLTGIAINIFHSTSSIARSFLKATIYALVLILVLVLLDLRRLDQTLLAVSVLALGLPMLVATMGFMQVNWNFANFFGLPILIGAGHEYGVFLVHRYREAMHDPRRPWRKWDVSDRALLLCAYITCGSFGFFWAIAHHQGLRSLGLVMAVGIACIYLSAVLVLRPLLVWRLAVQRRKSKIE
jgi:predicted RND superfamily exporter protein